MSKRVCKTCGLVELPMTIGNGNPVPFINDDTCLFCDHYSRYKSQIEPEKEKSTQRLREIIKTHKGKGRYDAIVLYTGGKDSAYTLLYAVKELGLKALALTWDNGFFDDLEALGAFPKLIGADHKLVRMEPGILTDFYRHRMHSFGRFCTCPMPALVFCGSEIMASEAFTIFTSLSFAQNLFMIQAALAGGSLGFVNQWNAMAVASLKDLEPVIKGMAYVDFITGDLSEETLALVGENLREWEKMSTQDRYGVRPGMIIPWDVPKIYDLLQTAGWTRHFIGKGRTHTSCPVEECKGFVGHSQQIIYSDVLEISAERRAGQMSEELYQKEILGLGYCDNREPRGLDRLLKMLGMTQKEFEAVLQKRRLASPQVPVVNPRNKSFLCPEKPLSEVESFVKVAFRSNLHM